MNGERRRGMSKGDWRRIRTGEGFNPGWSGIMQVTNLLVACDFPDQFIETVLTDPDNVGTRFIHTTSSGRRRPSSVLHRQARNAIRRARRYQQGRRPIADRGEVQERIQLLREAMDNEPSSWKGKAGATDYALMDGALRFARRAGKLRVHLGVRDLAVEAAVGTKTAWASRRRLVSRGWLRMVEEGRGIYADTFEVQLPPGWPAKGNTQIMPLTGDIECFREDPAPDLWWWHVGLGKTKARYYRVMSREPIRTRDLAAVFEVGVKTAQKHCAELRDRFGLVEYFDGGWRRSLKRPQHLETDLGLKGRRTARRDQYRVERKQRSDAYEEFVEDLRRRRRQAGGTAL